MTFEDVNWMQNKGYSAREDRQLIAALVGSEGVFTGHVVSQRGAGANMSVDITLGRSAVQGDDQANQGMYVLSNISTDNVVIGAAPGSNSRIDLVCIRVNDPNATGPAGDNGAYVVVAGTAAASPAVPALPTSAIPIAQVLVATGTAAITNAMITDVRAAARMRNDSPYGSLLAYAGPETEVPVEYALCRGQAISRTTYFGLFRVLGTTYGAGDGTSTFNLPDLRGRVPIGLDNMGGSDAGILTMANTLGAVGGEEKHALTSAENATHTHVQDAHGHTGSSGTQSADHTHSGTTSNESTTHSHSGSTGGESNTHYHFPSMDPSGSGGWYYVNQVTFGGSSGLQTYGGTATVQNSSATGPNYLGHTHAFTSGGQSVNHTHTMTTGGVSASHSHTITVNNATATNQNSGSGTAHNNLQPYILMNWIMRIA